MLSVVIPIRNVFSATDECIDLLVRSSLGDIDIIVIDNGSDIPYVNKSPFVRIIRNETNLGFWPSMLQGISKSYYNYVLCQHNDVFIYQSGFDQIILKEFQNDPNLALAGFFGGRGIALDGGRGWPESNMVGRRYGTHGNLHGHVQKHTHPAVVFDSLAIVVDKEKLQTIDYETIPPYHWTDRVLCFRMLKKEYRLLTIGIEFDHGGSFTAIGNNALNTFAEDWCKQKGLELDQNWDHTLYMYGLRQFQKEWIELFGTKMTQLWVDSNFMYKGIEA